MTTAPPRPVATPPPTGEVWRGGSEGTSSAVPRTPVDVGPPWGGGATTWEGTGQSLDYWLAMTGNGAPVEVPRETLNSTSRTAQKSQAMVAGAGSVIPVLYGERRIGGRVIAALTDPLGKLILAVAWCRGPCGGVQSYTIGDEPPDSGVTATHYDGTQTAPDPTLIYALSGGIIGKHGKLPPITFADVYPGLCYSVFVIPPAKSQGFPILAAIVRGMMVATTDGGTKAYSAVPAYCIADFITAPASGYGLGSLVNWDDVAALATFNNASIGTPAETRNILNVALDSPQEKRTWLSVLCDYAGCWAVKQGNTYRLAIDQPGSAAMSVGAGDILQGSMSLAKRDIADAPTVVQVRYTDTTNVPWVDATATAYAPGVLAGTVRRRVSQIAKPGITRHSEAYRYAVERLNDALVSDLTASFTLFDAGIQVEIGDILSVTHPIGLSSKLMRVTKAGPTSAGRWAVAAREYDPAKYSDAVVDAPTTVDTSLPSPLYVPDVTGFAAQEVIDQLQTGRFISRLNFTWTGPTLATYPLLDHFDITLSGGTTSQTFDIAADADSFTTDALPENVTWTCQLRAHSVSTPGEYALLQIITNGKQDLPADVASISGYSTNGETRLFWPAVADRDVTGYELRYGTTSATWETATLLALVAAPTVSFVSTIVPQGVRRIFIKALDSVRSAAFPNGQPSANAAYVDITVTANASLSYTAYPLASPTLSSMVVIGDGTWLTDNGTAWNTLFGSAMSTYTNVIDTYSAGSSGLVSDTIDIGAATAHTATLVSTLGYTDLSGTAQPYIEWKLNSGDSWTRINAQTGSATLRYIRAGVTTTGAVHVAALGQVSVEFAP